MECQSVPDCVGLRQGLLFKLKNQFEHRPFLAHELCAYFVVKMAGWYCDGLKEWLPRLRGPEASGPVVFVV